MLKDKRLFLLDIDGTVCIGERLISGTKQFLEAVKESGGQFVFITNNSTRGIDDYIRSFQKLGIATDYTNFITASYATVQYLKQHYEGKLIYVMGTKSLMRELKRNGIRVTVDCQDPEIACVLVSYDNQLTYEKIMDTCQILSTREVGYIATNLDYVCPIEFGYVPDCGAICQMLEHAVKRTPQYMGKPGTAMVESALKLNHYPKEKTLIVGDRLYTDILCGYSAGVETALVLTGEATKEEAEKKAAEEAADKYHYDGRMKITIFVPEGEEAPERSILERPELQVYISDFGRNEGDCAVLASADGKIIGAAWARIMDDYGHIDDETPSLAIAVYKNYRGKGIGKEMLSLLLSCLQERAPSDSLSPTRCGVPPWIPCPMTYFG